MKHLTITGEIIQFFDINNQYSRKYENQSFPKRKIVVDSDGEQLTISFNDKYIKLLEYCQIGSEIEINVNLKGRMWRYQEKDFSNNELVCNSLKIIKNNKIDNWIKYKNRVFNLKRSYNNNNLFLELVDLKDGLIIPLCVNHSFPKKELNRDHIFLWDIVDNELIKILEKKGILINQGFIGSKEGYSGYVCKVLILELFGTNEFLFDESLLPINE